VAKAEAGLARGAFAWRAAGGNASASARPLFILSSQDSTRNGFEDDAAASEASAAPANHASASDDGIPRLPPLKQLLTESESASIIQHAGSDTVQTESLTLTGTTEAAAAAQGTPLVGDDAGLTAGPAVPAASPATNGASDIVTASATSGSILKLGAVQSSDVAPFSEGSDIR
jgi:hypothetical protein